MSSRQPGSLIEIASATLLLLVPFATAARSEEMAPRPYLVFDAGGHTAAVNKVRFTADGQQLASVSNDKTIRLWDVNTGESLHVLRPPIGDGAAGMLYALAISRDGKWLAAGGYDFSGNDHGIYLIDATGGEIKSVLRGHTNVILDLQFSPDGHWLVSASADKTARLWDLISFQTRTVFRGHRESVYAVAFSPDSSLLATASLDHTAAVWSVRGGNEQAVLRGHADGLQAIAFSPSGASIATGCNDQSVSVWTISGQVQRRYERLGNRVTSVAFSPDGRDLFFTLGGPGEKDGGGFIDVGTTRERLLFTRHENSVLHGNLSPDGSLAATADANGDVFVWRTADGSVVHRLASRGHRPWSAAWDREIGAIAWGNTSEYHDPNNRGPLEFAFQLRELEFAAPRQNLMARASTESGPLAIRPTNNSTLLVTRAGQAEHQLKLEGAYDEIRCFTLVGNATVAVGSDFGLSLFDRKSGQHARSLSGHFGAVWAVAPSPDGRYLLSAGDDQTLRIWSASGERPLLSLFFADLQWIAWTPEGYYAASPGGEQLMGWQINNGRDRLATFHPAVRFHSSLYRPDVIRRLLDTGSVSVAFATTDQQQPRTAELTAVERVLPPLVSISQPTGTAVEVSQPQLVVRATARSRNDQPVTAFRLLLDGRPYEGRKGLQVVPLDTSTESSAEAERSWTVELSPGRHTIAVQAETTVSKGLSEAIELTYREPTDVEGSALPNLYVLAVGVANYPGTLKLDFASKDAEDFARILHVSSMPLFGKVNVRLITNEQATRREILAGWSWLRREATQRDISVFFYSGHGAKDEAGNFYLVPIDGEPSDLLATCVSGSQFKDALAMIPGRVLVFLDACHAGAASGDRRKAAGGLTDDLIRDLVTDDYGAVVMCSSMGREFSMESQEHHQGYFTLALVEALSGKADYNHDGFVYLTEIDTYLSERIKSLTDGKQHPVTAKPATIRSFPITKP